MKIKIILIVLISYALFSCRTEEDQHPDLPMFGENFSKELLIEKLEDEELFRKDTKHYVFTLKKGNIIVRDKKSSKIIKTPINIYSDCSIDEEGNIYNVFREKNQLKCIKYSPPLFNDTIFVESIDVGFLRKDSILKNHKLEMKQCKIVYKKGESNKEYYNFISNKRNESISKLLKNYKYIFFHHDVNLIRYKDGREYFLKLNHFNYQEDKKYFEDHPDDVKIIRGFASYSERSNFINNNYTLKEFDGRSLLGYGLTGGGNHYVPGFKTYKVYYYELKIGDKSYKFKSEFPMKKEISFNDEIIITNRTSVRYNRNDYKIKVKS